MKAERKQCAVCCYSNLSPVFHGCINVIFRQMRVNFVSRAEIQRLNPFTSLSFVGTSGSPADHQQQSSIVLMKSTVPCPISQHVGFGNSTNRFLLSGQCCSASRKCFWHLSDLALLSGVMIVSGGSLSRKPLHHYHCLLHSSVSSALTSALIAAAWCTHQRKWLFSALSFDADRERSEKQ
jgi:hypothetical protein